PYAGVDDAFAIPIPEGIAAGQPHLWPTAVWFNPDSQGFSLTPEDGSICLDYFKTALFAQHAHRMTGAPGVTMADAAVAFVALHMAYCLGAAIESNSEFKLSGFNAGVPVAALKDRPTVETFERVFSAGLTLISAAPSISLSNVRAAFESAPKTHPLCNLYTELAGAIAGYCSIPRSYVGGHMIIGLWIGDPRHGDVYSRRCKSQTHRNLRCPC
ncbi:MAG TPA: hypothetical protein VFT61_08530, partial [Sphingomicrobium sp.]|nr:hypothetical protein [Sphingomicrobium sp.]